MFKHVMSKRILLLLLVFSTYRYACKKNATEKAINAQEKGKTNVQKLLARI